MTDHDETTAPTPEHQEEETTAEPAAETSPSGTSAGGDETTLAEQQEFRLSQEVQIEDAGPCRKHVRIVVPRKDIEHLRAEAVEEMARTASVPGFRVGHVPKRLIERRFRKELAEKIKQELLLKSLDQLTEEADLDPINEPNLDVEAIELPDEGDLVYEFDVEVRPEFELPQWQGLKIRRHVQEIGDEEINRYLTRLREEAGRLVDHDGALEPGDFFVGSIEFYHQGRVLRRLPETTVRVRPLLRFRDAELEGFDKIMVGARPGDTREADLVISTEAEDVAMRGEPVHVKFTVREVKRLELPELNREFFERYGVEDEEELKQRIREMLERQREYQQRQEARAQVLAQITEAADWDLPEGVVRRQVENALRREILEMQEAGFTPREIQARENELRQRSVSMTRQALKEHFVLDRIATEAGIEVTPADIETQILLIAGQRGESPRRVRARLEKSGMIENLEAQIREQKTIGMILEHAEYEDIPVEEPEAVASEQVEALPLSVCGNIADVGRQAAESEADRTAVAATDT